MGSLFVGLAVFGVWMVTAGSLAGSEVAAAAIVAVLGAVWSAAIGRVLPLRMSAPLRWLKALPLSLIRIPSETARVVGEVLRLVFTGRQPRAGYQLIGVPEVPRGATPEAWEAYLTAALSLSPNSVVIGMDPQRRTLLAHQLISEPPAKLKRTAERLA